MLILRAVFLALAVVFALSDLPGHALGLLLAALFTGRSAAPATPCLVVTITPAPGQGA